MSNLFDEFFSNEPPVDIGDIETDIQRSLREEYEYITERNLEVIKFFDPLELESSRQLVLRPIKKELEEDEPQLTRILRANMLKDCGLEIPVEVGDSRYILNRVYASKKRTLIYEVARDDDMPVSIYCETASDGMSPLFMKVLSVDDIYKKITKFEKGDKQRSDLINKLGFKASELSKFRTDELQLFSETLDNIRNS